MGSKIVSGFTPFVFKFRVKRQLFGRQFECD